MELKTAVVLCGGGTKGVYELGVWNAMRELGISYDIVTGASIGAMNGALMVQQDFELASKLWLSLMNGMSAGGEDMENLGDIDEVYAHIEDFKPSLSKYVKNRGVDVTPLRGLVDGVVSEEKVRESSVDFGLVTVGFPSLRPYELTKSDIPVGEFNEYLMATSAIFPALPMHRIGNELYLDGCYYDNLPIDLAIKMGAEQIIAVDLHETPVHSQYVNCPFVNYIKPSAKLGGMLNFDEAVLKKNLSLGYRDALRCLGGAKGFKYCFYTDSLRPYEKSAIRFVSMIAREEAGIARGNYRMLYKLGERRPLSSVIETDLELEKPDRLDYFIRGAELCGEILEIDKERSYLFSEYIQAIENAQKMLPDAELDKPLGKMGPIEILPVLSEIKLTHDSAYVMNMLLQAIMQGSMESNVCQAVMLVFPREYTAAMFLASLA